METSQDSWNFQGEKKIDVERFKITKYEVSFTGGILSLEDPFHIDRDLSGFMEFSG